MNARIDRPSAKRAKAQEKPSPDLSPDQVAAIAYHLYLENGCEDGHDQEHWFRAERILKDSLAQSAADAGEQTDQNGARSFPKGREPGLDHSQHQTTGREEVRRQQITPAARQSLRSSK